jgi:hypothetical protein
VESKILVMQSLVKGTTKMNTLDIIKKTISEAEGGGTSVEGKKSLESQKKRAQILLKSADLRLKQQKEREALARQKSAVKEEVEELDELSTKKLSDYSDKASDDVHRLDKEGNNKKANKRFDGVVRASDKMTDAGKKLRGTPMKEEEKKMKGEDPCWKGYEMVGTKKKNGKEVPNCVPKEGVKEETIAESGGVKVFKTDDGHIEKYGENNFAVYLDGKKQKAYDSLEAAKKALASGKEQEELDEAKVGDTVSFHHELKAAPGKKVKKSGTVEKVEGDVVHVKVKDKYGVMRHQVKSGDLVKEESEQMNEASKYQIYHPSYSSAVQHALSQAEKQGFTVDMDDYTQKVAFGPKKPSVGKTNSFSITLMDKSGKISKKKLQMQVYGMEGGKYELNMYTEEVKLDEGAVKSNEKLITVKHKDSGKELRVVATAIEKYKRMGYELVKEDVDLDESQAHTAPETVKHYMKGQKTSTGISKWVAKTIDKKKAEVKEAEEFKQGGKPLEKKFNKAFKAMGVDADIKKKTINNVSINEEEKPKKSFKDMKKKKENTSDKDVKAGEKLSGKQEPIDLSPTVDNNR